MLLLVTIRSFQFGFETRSEKRQNPLQSFSFSYHRVCDDGLLFWRPISIFHILLLSASSSLSVSIGGGDKTQVVEAC